jgi:ABC-type lipoprotein export system ATPase subunit
MPEPVIKAEALVRKFDGRPVLNSLDLDLMPGEFCAITGKSGVGKSTLLGILGTLDLDFQGSLHIRDTDVLKCTPEVLSGIRRECLGFIFQDFHLLPNLPAIDNILLPAVFSGTDTREVRDSALAVMERLGLRNDTTPSRFLSRGERQRVASARALVNDPEILLADEPTASLDEESESSLFDLLDSLRGEKGFAMLAVVHSRRVLSRADRILELREGVLHAADA